MRVAPGQSFSRSRGRLTPWPILHLDVGTIEDVVAVYQPALIRLARYPGADEAESQRLLVRAWRSALATHQPETDAFRTTLFREAIVAVAALEPQDPRAPEEAVEADRFEPAGSRWEDWFTSDPTSFASFETDEASVERAQSVADEAIARLPFEQRVVLVLR